MKWVVSIHLVGVFTVFFLRCWLASCFLSVAFSAVFAGNEPPVRCGYAEKDITPKLGEDDPPVWMAGYAVGRRALGVHDPLMVRCLVLQVGDEKVVFGAVDLIGLQIDAIDRIRDKLADYKHITINSTHNHEGPDVIGIWGKSLIHRGVDETYIDLVVEQTIAAVRAAEQQLTPVTAAYGTAQDDSLMDDNRLPAVKDGVLRVVRFENATNGKPASLLVQWNCHPEALGPNNRLITADFPAYTIAWLKQKYNCPVLYMSGAVGGLMAPPKQRIKDAAGNALEEGDYEYARVYGEAVGQLAAQAMEKMTNLSLGAPVVAKQQAALHVNNKLYRLARQFGVLKREGREWKGNAFEWGDVLVEHQAGQEVCIMTEVSYLKLGDLHIANIPGEMYPELVYGKHVEPVDAGADFPDAPLEPSVASLMPSDKWLLFGLANDEIGYIIPKRQWDEKPPYCFGRERPQYGEVNSCGPDSAPTIIKALQRCIQQTHTVPALSKE